MILQRAALLNAGIGLIGQRLRLAVSSWMQDRTDQARRAAISYAVAAGLYAAAGIFAIAAAVVGVIALFRWIEMHEGTFAAFGIVGGVLLALAILCAAIAASAAVPKDAAFPPLSTRMKMAVRGNPVKSAKIVAAPPEKLARSIPSPAPPAAKQRPFRLPRRKEASPIPARAGLVMAATLLGWAVARRMTYPRKPAA